MSSESLWCARRTQGVSLRRPRAGFPSQKVEQRTEPLAGVILEVPPGFGTYTNLDDGTEVRADLNAATTPTRRFRLLVTPASEPSCSVGNQRCRAQPKAGLLGSEHVAKAADSLIPRFWERWIAVRMKAAGQHQEAVRDAFATYEQACRTDVGRCRRRARESIPAAQLRSSPATSPVAQRRPVRVPRTGPRSPPPRLDLAGGFERFRGHTAVTHDTDRADSPARRFPDGP
jgi:hypothetical protein